MSCSRFTRVEEVVHDSSAWPLAFNVIRKRAASNIYPCPRLGLRYSIWAMLCEQRAVQP